jgi:hypothetical protein
MRLLALVLAASLAAQPAFAAGFLRAIDDVPLADGLSETAEPVVFNSPTGRVVRTTAEGQVTREAVRTFYLAALPPLGWRLEGEGAGALMTFTREREKLVITAPPADDGAPLRVGFELVVRAAPTALPE